MADLSLTPYVVRRETDRWLFVPSRTLVGLMTFGFAAVSVFMLYLSTMFFTHAITPVPTNLFGPILLLSSGLLAFWAVRAWRTRHIRSVSKTADASVTATRNCAPPELFARSASLNRTAAKSATARSHWSWPTESACTYRRATSPASSRANRHAHAPRNSPK